MNLKPIKSDFLSEFFKMIIAESKRIQQNPFPLVGFLGEHGAYSEIAALGWKEDIIPVSCREISGLKQGLLSGIYDYCVLPVENTTSGIIEETYSLIEEEDVVIEKEFSIPIHHCLLSLPDIEIGHIRKVISHPHALSQCREFIFKCGFMAVEFWDTAASARMLSEERPADTAVIASSVCSRYYGLRILKYSIEDSPNNSTKFLVLKRSPW